MMKNTSEAFQLLKSPPELRDRILFTLNQYHRNTRIYRAGDEHAASASAVVFLIGAERGDRSGPCLILNKRSAKIRQPGDLCCPGGSVNPRLDALFARLLRLPGTPLSRWPHTYEWRKSRQTEFQTLARLFAGALRESFEEMRLNPLSVTFLGPLPPQSLAAFKRDIYPMICWLPHARQFNFNWEVEKIIYVPLRKLLDSSNYIRYRLHSEEPREVWGNAVEKDFPCFLHENQSESEKLWGATFRITMMFLNLVFGFQPPDLESLPVSHGELGKRYLAGNR